MIIGVNMRVSPQNNIPDPNASSPVRHDHLKNKIKDILKLGYLLLARGYHQIFGHKAQSNKLTHKISHLEAKFFEIDHSKFFKDSLIVYARNVPKMKFFDSSYRAESLLADANHVIRAMPKNLGDSIKEKLLSNAPEEPAATEDLRRITSQIEGGVCAGACADFARRWLEASHNESLESIASRFETGVGKAGLVNQYIYESNAFFPTKESVLKNTLDGFQKEGVLDPEEAKIVKFLVKGSLEPHKQSFESLGLKENNAELNTLVSRFVIELNKAASTDKITPRMIKQIFRNIYKETPVDAKVMERFTKILQWVIYYKRAYKKIYPHAGGEKVPLIRRISQLFERLIISLKDLFSHKPKIDLKLKKMINYPEMQINSGNTLYSLNHVLKARGLKIGDNLIGIRGAKDDEEAVDHLLTLKAGTYDFTFNVKGGVHATLFIKDEEQGNYIWDPNIGLLKCPEEETKKYILDYLNYYSLPKQSLKSHFVQISAYERLNH